jgi:cytosine permease
MGARRWWHSAGVWAGIGASPAALVLGASLAAHHGGALPVLALAIGVMVAVALLAGQSWIGLMPPHGDGGTLATVLPGYVSRPQQVAVALLLLAAMIGWLAFNSGLGGAAVASLAGTSQPVGVAVFGVPLLVLALAGISRWNTVAVLAAASALALVLYVALDTASIPAAHLPVTLDPGEPLPALADVAALIGYVSVFSVRGPDFTAGMRGPRDLMVCVALLVVPLVAVVVLGALMWSATGHTDLVAELARSPLGTALVALATVAPALTSFFSGGLVLASLTPLSFRGSTLVVAVPGLLLGAAGFQDQLLPLLAVLGASLPALVLPMAVEAHARRRGATARRVPAATWLPASVAAVILTGAGFDGAPVVGLALAGVAVAAWRRSARRTPARRGPPPAPKTQHEEPRYTDR